MIGADPHTSQVLCRLRWPDCNTRYDKDAIKMKLEDSITRCKTVILIVSTNLKIRNTLH